MLVPFFNVRDSEITQSVGIPINFPSVHPEMGRPKAYLFLAAHVYPRIPKIGFEGLFSFGKIDSVRESLLNS